jgi:electron transfer flavoprotein beta subunit
MKILVPVKRVVDYNVKVRVKKDETDVELDNVKMSMNPFDEIAVEEALRLKEKGVASEIIAVSIGLPEVQETIRNALAMGADSGIFVNCTSKLEPLSVAKILTSICNKIKPDLVIMGKQAIDDDMNATGQMLSAILNWGQATFASKLEIQEKKIKVGREIDGGIENIEVNLPAIVTTDLRLNEPRYASLPNIMKAKRKLIDEINVEDLNIDIEPRLEILKVEEPKSREAGIMVKSVDEMIEKLKNEAKVI